MYLNLFEFIKVDITVKWAAEKCCPLISRSGMTRCPFHNDHTPGMEQNDRFYYCFDCGAKGSVIGFVAKMFGLSALKAAKKLDADLGLDLKRCPPPLWLLHCNAYQSLATVDLFPMRSY